MKGSRTIENKLLFLIAMATEFMIAISKYISSGIRKALCNTSVTGKVIRYNTNIDGIRNTGFGFWFSILSFFSLTLPYLKIC